MTQATDLAGLPAGLEDAAAEAVVAWALRRFPRGRVAVVTALQAEGMALVDMALRIDPQVRVLTIDTGRLPAETHEFIDVVRARYRRNIEILRPDPAEVTGFVAEHGPDAFYISPELRQECCRIRKVATLDRVLPELDCWVTGLRRAQSEARAATPVAAEDPRRPGVLKLAPLATWSDERLSAYIREHDVPTHPLHARGYPSIGCAPCTRAVAAGEPARAGRWWWEQGIDSECGLHVAAAHGETA